MGQQQEARLLVEQRCRGLVADLQERERRRAAEASRLRKLQNELALERAKVPCLEREFCAAFETELRGINGDGSGGSGGNTSGKNADNATPVSGGGGGLVGIGSLTAGGSGNLAATIACLFLCLTLAIASSFARGECVNVGGIIGEDPSEYNYVDAISPSTDL